MFIFDKLKEELEELKAQFGGLAEFKEIILDHVEDKVKEAKESLDDFDLHIVKKFVEIEELVAKRVDFINGKVNQMHEELEDKISRIVSEQINIAFNKMFDPQDKVEDVDIITPAQVEAYLQELQDILGEEFSDRVKIIKHMENFLEGAKYTGESWYTKYKEMRSQVK